MKGCSCDISLCTCKKGDTRNLVEEITKILEFRGSASPVSRRLWIWCSAAAVVDASTPILLTHTSQPKRYPFLACFAHKNKLKTFIVTDILPVLKAIRNLSSSSWSTINKWRDIITKHGDKIKPFWVPSHIGLLANEQADRATKSAAFAPLIMEEAKLKRQLWKQIYNVVISSSPPLTSH